MAKVDIPVKYSDGEAAAILRQRMGNRSLSLSDRRQAEDQYNEMLKGFAKGGVVKKGKAMATKKIVEGKETYASKAAMLKHEKKEPKRVEKKEEKLAKGGSVKGVSAYAKGGVAKKKC